MRVQVNNQSALVLHRFLFQGNLVSDALHSGEWISVSTNGYSTSNKQYGNTKGIKHNGGNFPHGTEVYVTMKAMKHSSKRRFVGVLVEDTVQLARPDSRLSLFDDAVAMGCGYASYDRSAARSNFNTNFALWSWAGPVFMSRPHSQLNSLVTCGTGSPQAPLSYWNSYGAITQPQPQLSLTNAALFKFALNPSATPYNEGFHSAPNEYFFSACALKQNAAVDDFFMQARADPNTCNQA